MIKNRQILRKLMADHGLNARQIGELLPIRGRPRSPHTIRVWRCDDTHTITDDMLELLQIRIDK